MKRSDSVEIILKYLEYEWDGTNEDLAIHILNHLEASGLQPKKYINPLAFEEFGDIIKEKGEHWGYVHYIDKYPEHYFLKGRPYEYYLEGWEEE